MSLPERGHTAARVNALPTIWFLSFLRQFEYCYNWLTIWFLGLSASTGPDMRVSWYFTGTYNFTGCINRYWCLWVLPGLLIQQSDSLDSESMRPKLPLGLTGKTPRFCCTQYIRGNVYEYLLVSGSQIMRACQWKTNFSRPLLHSVSRVITPGGQAPGYRSLSQFSLCLACLSMVENVASSRHGK